MTTSSTTHISLRRAGTLVALLVACLGAFGAATAQAGTLTSEGGVLVFRAAPGEKNFVNVSPSPDTPGTIRFDDGTSPESGGLCTRESEFFTAVTCPMFGAIRIETGDNNDIVNLPDELASVAFTIDAGAGDDTLRGGAFAERAETLIGGPGKDKITGGPGDDVIRGGDGDDELEGQAGNDQLFGEGGNDKLRGDGFRDTGADVIDGGAGFDQTDGDWMVESGSFQPPITVSLDGNANDGRPGEGDNVASLEKIYLNAPATLIGGEDADEFTVFNTASGPTKLVGNGGDDKLTAFDYGDVVEGGAGNDTLAGGYGDDTVTGGPGRDQIHGDAPSSACNYIQCRLPFGNDTIHAQDGEVDSIDCGIGTDTAYVDASDVVSGCENVVTGSGGAPNAGGGGKAKTGSALTLKLRGTKLGKALRRGFVVDVTAPAKGKVSVVARRGGKIVARGARSAKAAKRVAVNVRFTKKGKRALRRAKRAKLALTVTFTPAKGAKVTAKRAVTFKR